MPRLFTVMSSGDGIPAAERDIAAFVRAWNEHHCCFISTVDFRLMDDGGVTMFPSIQRRTLAYRDIYPKGRSIVGGDGL